VHRIAERFIDWDSAFQGWLVEHFMLVRRTLGIDKSVRALDGFPTVALSARMTKPLFADLWHVRVEMSREWSRDGWYMPGAQRAPCVEPVRRHADAATRVPLSRPSALRAEFPLLETCVYLNSNSTGATPRRAKAVLDDYWRTVEHWRDAAWERWWDELQAYADELATLIGAPAGSVVGDMNVSTLFSRVLSCFDYGVHPRVVMSDLEFPALPHIIRAFARYGAVPVIVPSQDRVTIAAERLLHEIDEHTQLVCVSHATFETGALLDVAPIVRRAHEVGALVVLDAYASVGVVPLDVTATGVDFELGGAHKWLCGSYESAFLYVRPALLAQLQPAATGWIASANPLSFAPPVGWDDSARRFAGGTPAVLPALFSRPGLAIVRDLGVDAIRSQSLALTDHIIIRADEARITVATPRAHAQRGGIVALRFPGDAAVARALVASGFVCSYRNGLRIAPHFYNTAEEVDRFMNALRQRMREAS
jgi:selenocysteine lyase/cysteine desulfurase